VIFVDEISTLCKEAHNVGYIVTRNKHGQIELLASQPSMPDKPKPPARSRASEFYGFVAWASTSVLFVVYILWALFPDGWIEALGVDWYPSRYVDSVERQGHVNCH
jgi:hypothetical protein